LAALIFVSFDDLSPLDLFASAGVVRPKSDATGRLGLIHLVLVVTRRKYRLVREISLLGSR
jgi:hypothetical protein